MTVATACVYCLCPLPVSTTCVHCLCLLSGKQPWLPGMLHMCDLQGATSTLFPARDDTLYCGQQQHAPGAAVATILSLHFCQEQVTFCSLTNSSTLKRQLLQLSHLYVVVKQDDILGLASSNTLKVTAAVRSACASVPLDVVAFQRLPQFCIHILFLSVCQNHHWPATTQCTLLPDLQL